MNMRNEKDNLENWAVMWDKAQNDGTFPETAKIKPEEEPIEIDPYWANFNSGVEEVLNEDHSGPATSKADLADQAKDMGRVPNPVYYNTLGNDQDLEPWTPNWIDGKELEELTELKKDLYNLECEMNTKDGKSEGLGSIEKRIDSMKRKLNDLSNALTPDRFKEILD